MTIEEIREFMNSNKDSDDVREFKKSLMPKFDELMEDDSFKKTLESYADSRVSKAVDTYKSKTLPLAVEEEVKKRVESMNTKTPEQIKLEEYDKKLAELTNKYQQKEREELIQKNKNYALKTLSEKKLPTDVLDILISDEEEKTNNNLEMFSNMMENYTTNIKQEFMSGNNIKVPGRSEVMTANSDMPGEDATSKEWESYYAKKYSK